jgi:hypothetical protein
MKAIRPKFATLADWVSATWPLLTNWPYPVKVPKPAQAASVRYQTDAPRRGAQAPGSQPEE